MPSLAALAGPWEQRLGELVDGLDVPGAVLGVSHRGERIIATAGVCGLRNPVPVAPDTAFQLGSISKVYTATLLLVVAGAEILDVSVSELVPEAEWMEPEILVGHLLTHSSGLGGDCFADTGRGDDCLARYVERLATLPRDVPGLPGRRYSYCNSGYAVLGRLIEVLTGSTFDAALAERLLAPLHARATSTLPEQTILGGAALGHNRHDGGLAANPQWSFGRSCGPLGGVCASAGDVLAFAEMHLADGRAGDGAPLLEPAVALSMRDRHLPTPPLARPSARGLGWGIYDWPAGTLVGHDGETLGQVAKLRLAVEHDLAVVVFANAIPDGEEIVGEMEALVLSQWGLEPPRMRPPEPKPGFDARPYEGRYRNLMGVAEVTGVPGGLRVVTRYTSEGLPGETGTKRLLPIGDGAFVDAEADAPTRAARFEDPGPDGRTGSFFNLSGRVASRVPG